MKPSCCVTSFNVQYLVDCNIVEIFQTTRKFDFVYRPKIHRFYSDFASDFSLFSDWNIGQLIFWVAVFIAFRQTSSVSYSSALYRPYLTRWSADDRNFSFIGDPVQWPYCSLRCLGIAHDKINVAVFYSFHHVLSISCSPYSFIFPITRLVGLRL